MLAACASLVLASCSTSDPDAPFGFAAPGPSGFATQSALLVPPAPDADVTPSVPATEFVMDENDPGLPETVAAAPTIRPVSAEEAAALAQQQAPAQQDEAVAAAAPVAAPAPAAAVQTPETAQPPQPAAQEAVAAAEPVEAAEQEVAVAEPAAAFAPAEPPKKRGFLATLFGTQPANARPETPQPPVRAAAAAPEQPVPAPMPGAQQAEPARPIIQLASTGQAAKPLVASAAGSANALPGVRQEGLFEISRRSGLDDDSDIDLYEDEAPSYQVASAAGLARLAPNGLLKQTEEVDVACLKPSLVRVLKAVESHYGRKVVVTSGYRGAERNRRARGARNSLHMYCAAADVQVEGVGKWELAQYLRTMPGRGGVGTYCHTNSVHIDVGPERDWNWRCRRRK